MGKIEKASREYFVEINKIPAINAGSVFLDIKKEHLENVIDAAFKAGVEFAQRWIPAGIQPEENKTYLIKDKHNMVGLATWNGYWNCKFEKSITHWREINKL